ncbi:hypothetical protein B2J93_8127 [Marssonina coronariae]|uniref:Uncharacterized protein n=1 Tax=Diplocarpon coronariae TaxID=2795749 RepID=A0A218YTR3_9HELO|nr:hypothetical protein B2J93_8127 [Marssonina coronariae]
MTISLPALHAIAAGLTFNGFPEALSCPTATGTAIWTTTEQHELVKAHIAANVPAVEDNATKIELDKGASSLAFAYDKENKIYEFCFANGADLNKDGFDDPCSV